MSTILITGGTGSLGNALVSRLLKDQAFDKIIVFSRDELKQFEMREKYNSSRLRFFLGDVRDIDRLRLAFTGADVVIHAAALKQVSSGEYNPDEVIKTNVLGSLNVVRAAVDAGVRAVMAISSDKAVHPVNLYGATKLTMEKAIINGNVYAGNSKTKFSCCRYGNVVGSRGSLVGVFKEAIPAGEVTITDPDATRFWLTLPEAVEFVLSSISKMNGEIFVPKLRAASVETVYRAMDPCGICRIQITGLRIGEKLHETMLSEEELRRTVDLGDRYMVGSAVTSSPIAPYASNLVEQMSVEEVRRLIDTLQ